MPLQAQDYPSSPAVITHFPDGDFDAGRFLN